MLIRNAVVPVAGMGTRLLPATKSQPKEMLPVGRKPLVQYVVEELERNEISRVLFITGLGKHSIENHFDQDHVLIRYLRETGREDLLAELEFERTKLNFFYTRQRMQRGLGDAVLHAEHFAGNEPFVVALGDSILGRYAASNTISRMTRLFWEKPCVAVVAFEEVPADEVGNFGIALPKSLSDSEDFFEVQDLVEKPDPDEAPSRLAIAGRYVFSEQIFTALKNTSPGKGGEVQLTDALRVLLEEHGVIYGVKLPSGERRYDVGNPASYYKTFLEFALFDPELGEEMRAYVRSLLDGSH